MCWGGGGGDWVDRRGSEFNVDWKGVDCGVSAGSEAGENSVGASVRVTLESIGVSASIWIPLVGAGATCGVVVGWNRGCEVSGVLILWWSAAGAATGAVVRGQAGSFVASMRVSAGGAEPEGRQRRLAACSAAGAAIGAVVGGQAGSSVVSMGVSVGGAEPEGRQRRLAAWASSAEETSSCVTGMA